MSEILIKTINEFERNLREGTATDTDVNGMAKQVEQIYQDGATQPVRERLARLRQLVDTHLTQSAVATSGARESLQTLRDNLDRNYALANHSEGGVGTMLQAGLNRYTLFEREILPSDSTMNTVSRWALRGGIVAAGSAVVGTVGYVAWRYVLRPITNALGSIGTAVVGLGTTIGGTIAAFNWMPQSWRDTIRNTLPAWMTGGNRPQLSPEELKKREEARQKQEPLTDQALANARDRLRNPNPIPPAQQALKEIATELTLIQGLPSDRQTLLAARRSMLEAARTRMQIITRETPAEVLQAVTQVINGLDANIANLLNPPIEREVAGVRIRFEGNSILLDGNRLVIEASQYGSPWLPVTLNTLRKVGTNLQATATATILFVEINRSPVFTPAKIAEALNRYRNGQLPHEEPETDANGQPTGVQLKFSLGT